MQIDPRHESHDAANRSGPGAGGTDAREMGLSKRPNLSDSLMSGARDEYALAPSPSPGSWSPRIARTLKRLKSAIFRSREQLRVDVNEEPADGAVEIGGVTYPVKNWSARGFLAAPCDAGCKVTDRVSIAFSVGGAPDRITFRCRALVIRVDRERHELAGVFLSLDEQVLQKITNHFAPPRSR